MIIFDNDRENSLVIFFDLLIDSFENNVDEIFRGIMNVDVDEDLLSSCVLIECRVFGI